MRTKNRGGGLKTWDTPEPIIPSPNGSLKDILFPLIGSLLPIVGSVVIAKLAQKAQSSGELTDEEEEMVLGEIKRLKSAKKTKKTKKTKSSEKSPVEMVEMVGSGSKGQKIPKVSLAALEKILRVEGRGIIEN